MRPPATTTTAAAAGVEAVSVAAVRADDASVDAVPTAALAAVVQLLRAAQRLGERIEGASSVPPIFVPGVDAPMARALKAAPAELCRVVWDEEEGYLVHALDADAERAVWDEYGDKAALGRRWVDPTDGETYVVDTLRASDYDAIVSGSTVDYDDEYIRHLLSEPFRGLSRGIRKVAPASAEATTAEATTTDSNTNTNTTTDVSSAPLVSWCMTHRDLGTGLLSTVPTHRGRGFARLCAAAVVLAQSEFLAALREGEARWASTGTVRPSPPPPPPPQEVLGGGGVGGAAGAGAGAGAGARPHCYIVKGNAASKATMRGLGFREVEGLHEVTWMGVRPAMGG
ncbi:hypothetical protein DFJ73DRAFT_213974 [Zopfochytrium polystomum]|nr:hypothetical protein DFJ73DRAFT_213974 [Zopfochytrium polystomum]